MLKESSQKLLVKKLVKNAILPSRGSKYAAGYDLYAAVDMIIPKKGKGLVSTGLSFAVPPGNYGRIAPRSGLAVKKFIDTGAGVVDVDYRGEGNKLLLLLLLLLI